MQQATDDMESFHGQLRRGLRSFTEDIDELIPYFEKVIYKFVNLQVIYTGQAWANHWKKVSMEGYDIYKNRCVDYGNKEYFSLTRVDLPQVGVLSLVFGVVGRLSLRNAPPEGEAYKA